jgi:hypothetical protein
LHQKPSIRPKPEADKHFPQTRVSRVYPARD